MRSGAGGAITSVVIGRHWSGAHPLGLAPGATRAAATKVFGEPGKSHNEWSTLWAKGRLLYTAHWDRDGRLRYLRCNERIQ